MILKLVDRSWLDQDSMEPLSTFHIPAGLAFGIVCFTLGHPGNIPNYLIPIGVISLFAISRNRIRPKHIPVLALIACIAIVSIAPTVLGIFSKLEKQPYPRVVAANWMSSQGGQTFKLMAEFFTAIFWPTMSMLSLGKSVFIENAAKGFCGLLISATALVSIRKIWGFRR